MKKLLVITALLLASTFAFAGETYNFDVGGRTIHIDPDRGIVSIPGVGTYDSGRRVKRSHNHDDDDDTPVRTTPPQTRIDPAPAPVQQAAPSYQPAPVQQVAPSTSATLAPTDTAPPAPVYAPTPQVQQDAAPAVRPVAPVIATAPVAPPVQQSAALATGPLGVWLTEEKEGKVRIEQCGANLCGYAVSKSDQNGEKVLINMKPVSNAKWSGKIYDPKSGSTYDSTIAMKGTDGLRVQGCAFGGMFCGGQTWSRVN